VEVTVILSRLAIVGFGNVAQGLTQILHEQSEFLAERFGVRFHIVAVSDFKLGSVFDPHGLAPESLLQAAQEGNLAAMPADAHGWSVETMIEESNADTLVETSFTNLETGEPAFGYIQKALEQGMHVVTTNKGPIVLHLPQLLALAKTNQVQIGFEGTVMSGTPSLAMGKTLLAGAGITRIQGILNGTTNFILTQMENGATYEEALSEAQALGYAEADPAGDVGGHDAAGKVVILSNLILGSALTLADVDCQGITDLTPADIEQAKNNGKRWKLIGTIDQSDDKLTASVHPVQLPLEHPLAAVSGATNAITFSTTTLGDITLIGPGAGRKETGYALINDLLSIYGQT
jgi:homoserine dehydrogenase